MSHDSHQGEISADKSLSAESIVGMVVDKWSDQLGRGEVPDLEAYLKRYPAHTEDLRKAFFVLKLLHGEDHSIASSDSPRDHCPPIRIVGDFRLLREIGHGGMGVVYEAEQMSLSRRIALKILPFASALDPKQLARFKNEARAAASLEHPNIVGVYAVGYDAGVHYYAMQYVEGLTLAQCIERLTRVSETRSIAGQATTVEGAEQVQRQSPIESDPSSRDPWAARSPTNGAGAHAGGDEGAAYASNHLLAYPKDHRAFFDIVARLGADAADALEEAHQMGVVHRDVKPSNLLVDRSGKIWITDFGLAMTGADPDLTRTGDLLGTLRYMSPEQIKGQRRVLDHRTDIYALGATLYELVTGTPAFGENDRYRLIEQVSLEEPQKPSRINAAVPKDLETILLKAMAKEPDARYPSAKELADDLRRFIAGEQIQARRAGRIETFARWCRNPSRIPQAGYYAIFYNLWTIAWILLAYVSIEWIGLGGPSESVSLADCLLAVCVFLVPKVWIGWQAKKGKNWALRLGTIAAGFHLLVVLANALGWGAFFAGHYRGKPAVRWTSHSTLLTLGLIELSLYLVALYACRINKTENR